MIGDIVVCIEYDRNITIGKKYTMLIWTFNTPDAKDYFNLKSSSISNALTGRSSTANGFICKYKL